MNDSEFDLQVERYFEGGLDEAEMAAMEAELLRSSRHRERFWELGEIHALARDAARMGVVVPISSGSSGVWWTWRAVAALLVGLLLGVGGTGALWAVTTSLSRTHSERLLPLEVNGGAPLGSELGRGIQENQTWGGDVARWSGGNGFPRDSIRFVEAIGEVEAVNPTSCDVYRIVDLRSLRAGESGELVSLEFSAEFLDNRKEAGDQIRFTARIELFSGEPRDFLRRWPQSRVQTVSAGSNQVSSLGGAGGTWRRLTANAFVPSAADFALLQLVATRKSEGAPARFEEQYVGGIRLKVRSQPFPAGSSPDRDPQR